MIEVAAVIISGLAALLSVGVGVAARRPPKQPSASATPAELATYMSESVKLLNRRYYVTLFVIIAILAVTMLSVTSALEVVAHVRGGGWLRNVLYIIDYSWFWAIIAIVATMAFVVERRNRVREVNALVTEVRSLQISRATSSQSMNEGLPAAENNDRLTSG